MSKKIANDISEMGRVDQGVREECAKSPSLKYLVYAIDQIHNYRIHKIIKEFGYPDEKLIGKKGLRDFWLLVQHQDNDLKLQEDCLKKCGFASKEKAYLTDRVLVNQGKSQLYGTQFYLDKSKLKPRSIKDRENLEKRRKEAGLSPFAEYSKLMQNSEK